MEAPEIFRANVRAIMDARGISITELAEKSGIVRPEMSRILAGKVGVTLARGDRIAHTLGVTLSDLVKEAVLEHA